MAGIPSRRSPSTHLMLISQGNLSGYNMRSAVVSWLAREPSPGPSSLASENGLKRLIYASKNPPSAHNNIPQVWAVQDWVIGKLSTSTNQGGGGVMAWKPSDSIPQMGSLQPSSITPFSRKRDYLQGGMQTYVSGTVEQTKLSTLDRTGTALGLRSSDGDTEGKADSGSDSNSTPDLSPTDNFDDGAGKQSQCMFHVLGTQQAFPQVLRVEMSDDHLAWYRVHQTLGVRIIRSYLDVIDTFVFSVDPLMSFLDMDKQRAVNLWVVMEAFQNHQQQGQFFSDDAMMTAEAIVTLHGGGGGGGNWHMTALDRLVPIKNHICGWVLCSTVKSFSPSPNVPVVIDPVLPPRAFMVAQAAGGQGASPGLLTQWDGVFRARLRILAIIICLDRVPSICIPYTQAEYFRKEFGQRFLGAMRANEAKPIIMAGTPMDIHKHGLVLVRRGGRIDHPAREPIWAAGGLGVMAMHDGLGV
ncbi:uncharacterized protein An01g09440 [Aspergillus niger]|uniref:Contig An01c0310, genomic contig n=2 Tax=Aspergillus niger TaxID=5061 RepID=A2Q9X5_ASPNC|nr:uncharacterized protein An01g09440 [Aspergillus niger]CAK43994.1 unnamed protein product [Aspergillus niger]